MSNRGKNMWISTVSTIVSVQVVLILNVNHVQAMPRQTFRFHSKGSSSLPPFLTISPPHLTSPPKFQPDFDLPSFMVPSGPAQSQNSFSYGPPPSQSSFGRPSYGPPPSQSYGPPPSQTYGPPPSQSYGSPASEYGPPKKITKSIYIHVPPPEPEIPLTRAPLTTVAPQKHYRIVFIKTPINQPATLPTIPVQPQNEEKTLVYVLVRKPDELPELILPRPASTTPSKPEVYFIRYQAQKESNDAPYPPSSYSDDKAKKSVDTNSATLYTTLGPPLAVFGMKNNSIPK